MPMDYDTLRYEQDDHVVTLTYDRPDQRNAVSRTMNRGSTTRGSASATTPMPSCS